MNLQEIISLTIVVLAAALLIRGVVLKRRDRTFSGCESGCGCSTSALIQAIPPERLQQLKQKHSR